MASRCSRVSRRPSHRNELSSRFLLGPPYRCGGRADCTPVLPAEVAEDLIMDRSLDSASDGTDVTSKSGEVQEM